MPEQPMSIDERIARLGDVLPVHPSHDVADAPPRHLVLIRQRLLGDAPCGVPSANLGHVLARQQRHRVLGPSATLRARPRVPPLVEHIQCVLTRRASEEVVRPHAGWHVAAMADVVTTRNRPDEQLVRQPVCPDTATAPTTLYQGAIARCVLASHPQPARAGLANLGEKAIGHGRDGHALASMSHGARARAEAGTSTPDLVAPRDEACPASLARDRYALAQVVRGVAGVGAKRPLADLGRGTLKRRAAAETGQRNARRILSGHREASLPGVTPSVVDATRGHSCVGIVP